ncbi:hypothetical protein [Ammoniphilus sp. YIM 78166]|nr:hypothetical protein [Ammoniphilus sp. YIM 78166]
MRRLKDWKKRRPANMSAEGLIGKLERLLTQLKNTLKKKPNND